MRKSDENIINEEKQGRIVNLFTNSNERKMIDYKLLKVISNGLLSRKSVAYLNYDLKDYEYVFQYICLSTMYLNMIDQDEISVNDIDIGMSVIYKGSYYTYQGESIRNPGFYLLQDNSKKKSKVTIEIGQKSFRNIVLADNNRQRSLKDYRNKLAEYFGIKQPCKNNRKKILIIINKKQSVELLKKKIKISTNVGLGKVLSGGYINNFEEIEPMIGLGHAEANYIIFSSDLFKASEFLMNSSSSEYSAVYIFGDSYVGNGQINDFYGLLGICKSKKITFNFFGSLNGVLNENVIKKVSSFDNIIFTPSLWKTERHNVQFTKIDMPKKVESNLEKLDSYVRVLDDTEQDFKLKFALLKLKKVLLSGNSAETFEALSEIIFEELEKESYLSLTGINEVLEGLFSFNSLELIRKEIEHSLTQMEDVLIITDKTCIDELKHEFSGRSFIHFATYDLEFSEVFKAKKVILISPNKGQRRKWLYSNFFNKAMVVYLSYIEEDQVISVKSDVKVFKKFDKFSGFSNPWQVSEIKKYVSSFENINQMDATEDLDKSQEKFELKLDDIVHDKLLNRQADVVSVVKLTNDTKIYGTGFGETLVVQEGFLHRKKIRNLVEGDIVFDSKTPYSDVVYRRHFSECFNKYSEPRNDNEKLDLHWKSRLIEFVRVNHYSANKVQKIFEEENFVKSVAFFQSWTQVDRMPMLPQNKQFILIVGKVTKDPGVFKNFESYYEASKNVKKYFSSQRDVYLGSLDNRSVDELKDMGIKFKKQEVIKNKNQRIKDFARDKTNRLIKEDYNGTTY